MATEGGRECQSRHAVSVGKSVACVVRSLLCPPARSTGFGEALELAQNELWNE